MPKLCEQQRAVSKPDKTELRCSHYTIVCILCANICLQTFFYNRLLSMKGLVFDNSSCGDVSSINAAIRSSNNFDAAGDPRCIWLSGGNHGKSALGIFQNIC